MTTDFWTRSVCNLLLFFCCCVILSKQLHSNITAGMFWLLLMKDYNMYYRNYLHLTFQHPVSAVSTVRRIQYFPISCLQTNKDHVFTLLRTHNSFMNHNCIGITFNFRLYVHSTPNIRQRYPCNSGSQTTQQAL